MTPDFIILVTLLAAAALALVWKFRSVDSIPTACGLSLGILILAAVTAAAVFTVAWDSLEQVNWWEFKDRHLLSDIEYTHKFIGWFHEAEGRYPREVSEDAGVEQWVDRVKEGCERRGVAVAEVRWLMGGEAGEDDERWELLVATDAEGKTLVVIYSDGTFGVSRRLLTRRASAGPKEMEILR